MVRSKKLSFSRNKYSSNQFLTIIFILFLLRTLDVKYNFTLAPRSFFDQIPIFLNDLFKIGSDQISFLSILYQSKSELEKKNEELLMQNLTLKNQLQSSDTLLKKIDELNYLLNLKEENRRKGDFAEAIIINNNSSNEITLNKGSMDGIQNGSIVINPNGLLGQLYSVNERTSKLRLITHKRFFVSGYIMNNAYPKHFIIHGNGKNKLIIQHISNEDTFNIDDLFITSGTGNMSSGYSIGRITKISDSINMGYKTIDLIPTASIKDSPYVFILK